MFGSCDIKTLCCISLMYLVVTFAAVDNVDDACDYRIDSANLQRCKSLDRSTNDTCLSLSSSVKHWLNKTANTSQMWIHTVLTEIIRRFSWSTIAILYSHQYELVVRQLVDTPPFSKAKIIVYRLETRANNTASVNEVLVEVAKLVDKTQYNFLLMCDAACVISSLETVNVFDEINRRKTAYWMFSKWLTIFPHKTFAKKLDLNNLAVIVCPTRTECRYTKITEGCIKKPDVITQILKNCGHSFCKIEYDNNSTSFATSDVFLSTQYGFNKRNLLIATHVEDPFVKKTTVNGTTVFDGFCMDILDALAALLNFTYTMVEPPDGEWGRYVNGRWSGLVGMCEDRIVDLTIAPLTVSVDRSKVMDFAYPFYHDKLVAIYKMPDAACSKWKTLLWPFHWTVFLSLGVTCIVTMVLLYSVDRKLNVNLERRLAEQQNKTKHTLEESILIVCAVLLRQDCALPPVSTPGRILIGSFWLFTILIAASYCGNLVAFLTIKKDIPPLKTLRDLVTQSQYTWGTIGGTFWMTLFEFSNRTYDQQMWQGLLKFNTTDSSVLASHFEEHRHKVEEGNYVFFSERSILQMWADENCDLVFLEEIFYKANFAIGFPLNSPYTRYFSKAMVELEQNGLLNRWKRKRWQASDKCTVQKQPGARVIGLVDIQSAFFVLAVGLLAAMSSAFIECFVKRILRKEQELSPLHVHSSSSASETKEEHYHQF